MLLVAKILLTVADGFEDENETPEVCVKPWPKKERGGIGLRDSGGSIMKMDNECSCQSLISIYLLVWGKLLLSFIEVERMREGTSCGKLHVWLLTDVYWLNWKVLVKRIQVEMQKYVFSKHF